MKQVWFMMKTGVLQPIETVGSQEQRIPCLHAYRNPRHVNGSQLGQVLKCPVLGVQESTAIDLGTFDTFDKGHGISL